MEFSRQVIENVGVEETMAACFGGYSSGSEPQGLLRKGLKQSHDVLCYQIIGCITSPSQRWWDWSRGESGITVNCDSGEITGG